MTGKRPSTPCPACGHDDPHDVPPIQLCRSCPCDGVPAGFAFDPAEGSVDTLIKGLRKAVKDDETEWVDANILRLLLDRYDGRKATTGKGSS